MTHTLYLSIIGAVVFIAAYIILRLLRDNERLIAELDWAESKAMALDADFEEAIQRNGQATEKIRHLNFQVEVLSKRLDEYNNETKAWEIRCNIVDTEHRKTIQQLYGRIGAMQRKINRLKSLP